MSKRSFQTLSDIAASCVICDARCDARNAQAWAHGHARKTGHVVYFAPVYKVVSSQGFMFDPPAPARKSK